MGLDIELCRKTEKREYLEVAYWRGRYDVLHDLYSVLDVEHDNDAEEADSYDAISYQELIEVMTVMRLRMEDNPPGARDYYAEDMKVLAKVITVMAEHELDYVFICAGY